MSRNSERLGAQTPDTGTPAPLTQSIESAFSFVVPTEFVDLPSQGRYYVAGHPLSGHTSIEVRQMTAKEEDLLTSRTLLKKGIVLERLIESLIVDKQIDAASLLVGDRNAILIATRVSGYGNVYDTQVRCPNCASPQRYTFDLNTAHIAEGGDFEGLEVVDNQNGTFTTTLPKTKIQVTLRLLTGRDEAQMIAEAQQKNRKKRKQDTEDNLITNQLRKIIVQVNEHSSAEAIDYVVDNIPSLDSRHLRLVYKSATPNIDLTQSFECAQCDHEQDMEVPLSADFFWPDR